jgi:hypothetical protein
MSEEPREGERSPLRRVAAIVRSWDGPNSRIGLEIDLTQMPWGPFDALGKRLNLLLPVEPGSSASSLPSESQFERALRHVEHAADRSGEFARLQGGNQELWLRSQETWEWIRKYLTTNWLASEVDGQAPGGGGSSAALGEEAEPEQTLQESAEPALDGVSSSPRGSDAAGAPDPVASRGWDGGSPPGPVGTPLPSLPGAASTLLAVAKALRALPLAGWEEVAGLSEGGAPTREEAIQTLQGVARVLSSGGAKEEDPPPASDARRQPVDEPGEDLDPDQVSFDFAKGYDEGYLMGRRVGLALGRKKGARPAQP